MHILIDDWLKHRQLYFIMREGSRCFSKLEIEREFESQMAELSLELKSNDCIYMFVRTLNAQISIFFVSFSSAYAVMVPTFSD